MNRLEKDLLFYSNYCLHSSNLINSITKSSLNSKIFFICIDDKKIKVPSFITRVPSIFLVKEKKVLVEDEIDIWLQSYSRQNNSYQPQQFNQQQQQMPNQQFQQQQQMPNQQFNQQQQMPNQQFNQQQQQMPPHQNTQKEDENNDEILAYHSNEMGSSLSGKYSFIDENNNSLNHNFSFLDGSTSDSTINTPKEFNKDENSFKSKSQSEFERLIEQRNSESFSKGVQRI